MAPSLRGVGPELERSPVSERISGEFVAKVVTPIRVLAQHTIDLKAGLEIFNPFKTIPEEIATQY